MNEFERQIRDAIAAARNGARHAEQSLTNPVWQAKSSMASLGGILPNSRTADPSPFPQDEQADDRSNAPPTSCQPVMAGYTPVTHGVNIPPGQGKTSGIIHDRPGTLFGTWENPYIAAAMPLLLLVERFRCQSDIQIAEIRPPIVREIQYFQQNLQKKQPSGRGDRPPLLSLLHLY